MIAKNPKCRDYVSKFLPKAMAEGEPDKPSIMRVAADRQNVTKQESRPNFGQLQVVCFREAR